MKITETTFRVVDFETTGIDEADRPVEVGWIDVDYDSSIGEWVMGTAKSQLLDPCLPITVKAMAIHHITPQMVDGKPNPKDFLPKVFEDGYHFAAHNAPFDARFAGKELGKDFDDWLCTMRLAKHLIESPSYSNQVLRYHLGYYDVPGEAHSAAHDVTVTAMLLCYLLSQSKNPDSTIEDLLDYTNAPVRLRGVVGFGKHHDKTWDQVPNDYLRWMRRQGEDDWDIDQWYTINSILDAAK